MTQHYTRNTVSASRYCKRCKKNTTHRVSDGRIDACLNCVEELEVKHKEAAARPPRPTARQNNLFLPRVLLVVVAVFSVAQAQLDAPKAKPFFDKETISEMSLSALALAADGYTTYAVSPKYPERNPILNINDAVRSRAGVSLYFGAALGAEVGSMYVFRRHSWIKRIIPLAVAGMEIVYAERNAHLPPLRKN